MTGQPRLASDVEILAQPEPGNPRRQVARNRTSGRIMEMTDREAFLCRQLDGATPLSEIRDRFRNAYHQDIRAEHLDAFVRQLEDDGFLQGEAHKDVVSEWEKMRPFRWLDFDSLTVRFAGWVGWMFTWPAWVAFGLLALAALMILEGCWSQILFQIENIFTTIETVGYVGSYTVEAFCVFVLAAIVIPFFSELAKGATCVHFGCRVPEFRYSWYMRVIPRFGAGIGGMYQLPREKQMRIASAGLLLEVILFGIGVLFLEIIGDDPTLGRIGFVFTIACFASLFFNVMPTGKQDGNLLITVWYDQQDLRRRAQRVAHAWLFREPAPEVLPAGKRLRFIVFGFLADAYSIVINVALFSLIGYLLVHWVEGLGAVIFLVLVYLRFEDDIWSFLRMAFPFTGSAPASDAKKNESKKFWRRVGWVALILVIICLIPYPFDAGGEFRTQPCQERQVRTEIEGQIESLPVTEGQLVKKGDIIIQLSRRMLEYTRDVTQASLDSEKAVLAKLVAGNRPEDIALAEQKVNLTKTGLDHSESALVRAEDLHSKKDMSDQDYDTVLRQRDIDREAWKLALRDLDLEKAGSRQEDIDAQKAVVQRLEATLANVKGDLDRTTIRTPIDGQVTTLYLDGKVGQKVDVGTVMAIVQDTRTAILRIGVPEQYAYGLKKDSRVRAKLWAYSGKIFEGHVTGVASVAIDKSEDVLQQATVQQEAGMVKSLNLPDDNVIPVLAEVENKDGLLKPDMTGYAKIRFGYEPLGYAVLNPIIRFIRVRVWSWIP